MRTIAIVLLLPLALLHCSDPAPAPNCTVACDAGVADGAGPDGGSGGGRGYDVKSYELVGRFDWARRTLVGSERVTVNVEPGVAIVELDAAVDVKKVQVPGGAELPFTTAPDVLRIDVSSLAASSEISFTIDYEATPSEGLVASISRDDDPVTTRVVYTDSEPTYGRLWLPANHRPSDRAEWRVELTVGAGEDVVANGVRTKDEARDGERVVRYEMAQPIPTYTMAFAAGELEHRDRTTGSVPLSVWFRRGLVLEPNDMLDFLTDAMTRFESLLGPYPWPSYAVVLLPEFSGGMENTTITFTTEASGQANLGRSLQAHELAHQWFGDFVTMATFDDVWIKEGMATFLTPEVDHARRDAEGKGRRFGGDFGFNPSDSIRDRSLVGIAKYTSGPYSRAAWLINQIRDRVGEDAFWRALRQVLANHALGSIGSDAFVRSFGLDEPTNEKILRLLDEKRVPAVSIATSAESGGTKVTLSLTDPGGVVIAPTVVTVVDAAGQAASSMLAPDVPVSVTVPSGGYLALDETDVHAPWSSFITVPEEYARIVSLFFPSSDAARAAFSTRTAVHQEHAIDALLGYSGRLVPPAAFAEWYATLDSLSARRSAGFAGCYELKAAGSGVWSDVLSPILTMPALTTSSSAYAACGADFANRTFGAELASIAANVDARSATRFAYLANFDYGAAAAFDVLSQVAVRGPSLQLRDLALSRLASQVTSQSYTRVPAEELSRWREFFRPRLAEAKSASRFQMVWRSVAGLRDDVALAIAAQKLHTVALSETFQRQVVCDAYRIAQSERPAAWAEFQDAAKPWDTLAAAARAVLTANGTGCTQ